MKILAPILTVLLGLLPAAATAVLFAALGTPGALGWTLSGILAGLLLIYGIVAAAVGAYDLGEGAGWVQLITDLTWSLPNTIFGVVTGLWLYLIFGTPDRQQSAGHGWISFAPRGSGSFGNSMLQTLGTVNLGGDGQHERMHLLQARIFGPLFLPLFALSYLITFLIQGLFTLLLGLILKAVGARPHASLHPPAGSVVGGYWGWIYYATPFEVWAYASGNP